VIPNGSSVVDVAAAPSSKHPVVLSAGRLWDEAKNIDAVCAAASRISWRTVVAGDAAGPTGEWAPSGAVSCLGRLPAEAMAEWYRRAAIYALPARYEPFGLSVVEAAAAGCALVLGDIRTLRENWDRAALFVPPDNRRALAHALDTLVRDDARRDALASAARRRARRFTVDAMTEAYLHAYNKILMPAAAA
jgi:glycosyltransferase involved in cell wall biosynthesis